MWITNNRGFIVSSVLKNFELDLDITSGQLVYVPSPNFSYHTIPEGCCLIIPDYQEMIIYRQFIGEGRIVVEGNLCSME